MGCEFGLWLEWNFNTSLEWAAQAAPNHRRGHSYVRDLNHLKRREPALYEVVFVWTCFNWIDSNDSDNSVFSFVRNAKSSDEFVVVVTNFTPVVRHGYRVGVPRAGFYKEILNSDSSHYWGSNVGNAGGIQTEDVPFHSHDQSLALTLAPLATIYLKLSSETTS